MRLPESCSCTNGSLRVLKHAKACLRNICFSSTYDDLFHISSNNPAHIKYKVGPITRLAIFSTIRPNAEKLVGKWRGFFSPFHLVPVIYRQVGSQKRDSKFAEPLTGPNQADSERSAHNDGAKTNRSLEISHVFTLGKGWSKFRLNRYAAVGDETLLHNSNKEQRTGRVDGKLSS